MAFPNTTFSSYITKITATFMNAVNTVCNSLYGTDGQSALSVNPTTNVVSLPTGQLKWPSSQNASSDPNTLDDYEEGTWTPVLTFATPGDLSVSYNTQLGTYTKIGRQVTLTIDLNLATFTHTTASGNLIITGSPFTALPVGGVQFEGSCRFRGYTNASYTYIIAQIIAGSTTVLFSGNGSGTAGGFLTATDVPSGGAIIIRVTITYFTA